MHNPNLRQSVKNSKKLSNIFYSSPTLFVGLNRFTLFFKFVLVDYAVIFQWWKLTRTKIFHNMFYSIIQKKVSQKRLKSFLIFVHLYKWNRNINKRKSLVVTTLLNGFYLIIYSPTLLLIFDLLKNTSVFLRNAKIIWRTCWSNKNIPDGNYVFCMKDKISEVLLLQFQYTILTCKYTIWILL